MPAALLDAVRYLPNTQPVAPLLVSTSIQPPCFDLTWTDVPLATVPTAGLAFFGRERITNPVLAVIVAGPLLTGGAGVALAEA